MIFQHFYLVRCAYLLILFSFNFSLSHGYYFVLGCVNALHFNQTGTLLASGSDDLNINIWEFESSDKKPSISYNSGHRSNVFQSKFMPNSNDLTVMTCGRDGQV